MSFMAYGNLNSMEFSLSFLIPSAEGTFSFVRCVLLLYC